MRFFQTLWTLSYNLIALVNLIFFFLFNLLPKSASPKNGRCTNNHQQCLMRIIILNKLYPNSGFDSWVQQSTCTCINNIKMRYLQQNKKYLLLNDILTFDNTTLGHEFVFYEFQFKLISTFFSLEVDYICFGKWDSTHVHVHKNYTIRSLRKAVLLVYLITVWN